MRFFITAFTITTILTGLFVISTQAQSLLRNSNQKTSFDNVVTELNPQKFTTPDYHRGEVQHIVLFRYKTTVSEAERQQVFKRFLQLKNTAKRKNKPYIISIEAGAKNSSYEKAGQGFDQVFIVKFRSEGDRNYYVGTPAVTDPAFFDPAHQKFKEFVGPLLEKNGALVYDFSSNK